MELLTKQVGTRRDPAGDPGLKGCQRAPGKLLLPLTPHLPSAGSQIPLLLLPVPPASS